MPIFAASAQPSGVNEGNVYLKWERLARDHAYVTPLSVSAPLGSLVLVKYKDAFCAIRFTEFHRGGDEKSATIFNSGEETLFATAEQTRIEKNKCKWRVLERKTIPLVRGPVVGLGRFGLAKGNIGLRCGDAPLEWTYPNNVSLGSYTQAPSERAALEVAPTLWSDVSQIDLADARLRWYRYDEGRGNLTIEISDLPGFGH